MGVFTEQNLLSDFSTCLDKCGHIISQLPLSLSILNRAVYYKADTLGLMSGDMMEIGAGEGGESFEWEAKK